MEVSTSMKSSVPMQQVFPEMTPDNEAVNLQSNPLQSARFSELFDQCAGTGNWIGKSTDSFCPAVLSKAIVPSMQAGRQLTGHQTPDSGSFPPEFAAGFLQGVSPDEGSLPETMVESEAENDSGGYTQALDANLFKEPAQTESPWAPSFVPGNSIVGVDAAQQPLPEQLAMVFSTSEATATAVIAQGTGSEVEAPAQWAQNSGLGIKQVSPQPLNPEITAQGAAIPVSSLQAGMSGQEQRQVSMQPGYPDKTAQGGASPAPAGKVLLPESRVKAEQQAEPSSLEPIVNSASEVTAGSRLTLSAAMSAAGGSVSIPESGVPARPASFRETSLYGVISQGAESNPEAGTVIRGNSLQPGAKVIVPQPEAVSRVAATPPLATLQGEYTDDLQVPGREKVAEQATPLENPIPGENRRGGETAVNAYRAVAADALSQGKKGAATLRADILPSTPSMTPEADAANTGEAPQLIDIVFAEKGKGLAKGSGVEAAGKGEDAKSPVIATQPGFVQAQGELRSNGENRTVSPADDAKSTSPGHIHQQVRERLESGDYGISKGNITLKLHPEELGELKINLRMEDQRLKIEIVTENQSVKEALMQNLDTLKDTLSRQNIAMERFNVSTDLRQGFQHGARDERQLMQGDRGGNAAFQPATADDEPVLPKIHYGWDNDNSLVSLVL